MQDCYTTNGKRFLAILIDVIIVSIISNYVSLLLYFIFGFDKSSYSNSQAALLADINAFLSASNTTSYEALKTSFMEFMKYYLFDFLFSTVSFIFVGTIYFTIIPLISNNYQTLGRLAAGVKVVDKDKITYSKGRMFIREILCFLIPYGIFGGLFLLVSGIVALASRRSLTDMMSRTRMVPKYALDEEVDEETEEQIDDEYKVI